MQNLISLSCTESAAAKNCPELARLCQLQDVFQFTENNNNFSSSVHQSLIASPLMYSHGPRCPRFHLGNLVLRKRWEGRVALIEFRVDGQVGRESFEKEGLTEDVW